MEEISLKSDEEIIRLVQEGDPDLFGVIISRYESKLKRYGQKFLARSEDIEDLVQDTFIKAYENILAFKTDLRFSPWIYRIAHNTFVNELKKKSRYLPSSFDPEVLFPFLLAKETADDEALKRELDARIANLVGKLADKYREVVILYYYEDLSYEEIGEVLQVSTNTVGVRLNRALKQLRELAKDLKQ